jgi:hypothetical protein
MSPETQHAHAAAPATGGGVSLRLVLLPTEHGGWSFLFEPILLGLLVACSWAGGLVALAAVCAFIARQPLKLFVSDRQRGKLYPRTHVAERAFLALALVALGALAGAWTLAGGRFWPALAIAAPLVAIGLAFDLGKRSREAGAELAAAVALGAIAAAIALAGGMRSELAFGLWGVLAARTIPTILFVRARLRLEKGQKPGLALALAAHAVAIAGVMVLAYGGWAARFATWAMVLLAARAAVGLSPWRPRWKTWQLGVSEIVFGLVTVGCATGFLG